jgi:hypothetical protein
MPRLILPLLPTLLLCLLPLFAPQPVQARTMTASIARVTTAVATLQGVQVRLHWPAQAPRGELLLRAARVDAPDLGYAFRDLAWRCPLSRDGQGGWRCAGELQAAKGKPLRLSLDLATASTDAVLSQGAARFALHRAAATPDDTRLDLTRVPLAWAQALSSQAWADGRLKAGTLDGRLAVRAPARGPLRVDGTLALAGGALETADATIAAENVGSRFRIDYRKFPASTLLTVDGELRGGELLFGSAYIALPSTPVPLQLDAMQRRDAGWSLPTIAWRDGDVLDARGSAAFAADGALHDLDLALRSSDLAPLGERYLSGWLGIAGLSGLQMHGAFDAHARVAHGVLAAFDANLHGVSLRAADDRFRFDGLDGDLRFSAADAVDSTLRWQGGGIGDIAFGASALPLRSADGDLRLRSDVSLPVLGGQVRIDGFVLRPPSQGEGLRIQSGLTFDALDLGALAKSLGAPPFRGTLSGRIPLARYADERLDFEGGLTMRVFDGTVAVSELSMERPFGVATTLSADLDLDDLDLLAITEVFDFGSITGRLDGRIHDLRLVDWSATAFDAELRTEPKSGVRQRISQRAVQNISSVGDASFVGSLQGRLIGLFDDFGYRRIGISCRLSNEVCAMGGLRSAGNGFTIVEGAGVPRLDVVGYNRNVDWPTLVERLAAVGKGDVKPVFE